MHVVLAKVDHASLLNLVLEDRSREDFDCWVLHDDQFGGLDHKDDQHKHVDAEGKQGTEPRVVRIVSLIVKRKGVTKAVPAQD